jgi:hypothetical protein
MELTLKEVINSESDVIDMLEYKNYVHNRLESPHIKRSSWEMYLGREKLERFERIDRRRYEKKKGGVK